MKLDLFFALMKTMAAY